MNLVYSLEPIPYTDFSVFLAGPTPRKHSTAKSWRPGMVDEIHTELSQCGRGTSDFSLILPEDRTGDFHGDAPRQREWEYLAISSCSLLLFWVPRSMKEGMPALTTNVEFGFWINKKDVVLGFPEGADHVAYLQWLIAKEKGQATFSSMREVAYEVVWKKYLTYKNRVR